MSSDREVTQLLQAVHNGEPGAEAELFELVYQELKAIAAHKMMGQRAGHTLQPTALVNEAYLRLLGHREGEWENRSHFFAAAASAMRSILVDHARRHQAQKRGGGQLKVTLQESVDEVDSLSAEMLTVHEALSDLENVEPRKSRVVELHYFGGLTVDETATLLELSPRTIDRDLRFARAWLFDRISNQDVSSEPNQ